MEKRLYRDELHKKVGGVCAGLAEYFDADPTLFRVLFVVGMILKGTGLVLYVVLWIVLPKKPYPIMDPNVDYTVPPQDPGNPGQAGNPYGSNPYGGNPYGGNPYGGNPYTYPPTPPKQSGTTTAAIIIGVIMIIVGGSFLLGNLDVISWFDFWRFWPVIPIAVGVILMMSSGERKPKTKDDKWETAEEAKPEETKEENKADAAPADDAEPKA